MCCSIIFKEKRVVTVKLINLFKVTTLFLMALFVTALFLLVSTMLVNI